MKRITYLLIFAVSMTFCTSKPHYVVKGNIGGSDSVTFYLQKRAEGKTINIDSAVSKKGIFGLFYLTYHSITQYDIPG